MTVDVEATAPTVLVARARVRRVERVSPAFVRVTLESPAFDDLASNGFDTRLKLVFPGPGGRLPEVPAQPEEWYAAWSAMPEESRSAMRTYTVRDILEEDDARLLVVDLVVHEHGPQGPACRWALAAAPGAELQVVGPHRANAGYGGTEFDPGECRDLLLVADETAVPALARILADLGPSFTGQAFVEVPTLRDLLDLHAPPGVTVTWLVRQDRAHGRGLVDEVRRHLGLGPLDPTLLPPAGSAGLDAEVWETPRFPSSGQGNQEPRRRSPATPGLENLYSWIAGESWLVKALRRTLVTDLQVDRGQVAFMGYWKGGVSMRS